jgi:hypothetical protein
MVARTEQNRLLLQIDARLAMLQNALDDIVDLRHLIGGNHQLRSLAGRFI